MHGFRSSFRDWVGNETDFQREVAEAALAHVVVQIRQGDSIVKQLCEHIAIGFRVMRQLALDQAGAILETLKSILSTSPVGPLTIGHHDVEHISNGFGFLAYFMRVKWGKLHTSPRWRAFERAEYVAAAKYSAAGGGMPGMKAQVLYLKRWRRSFPLWNADWWGKWYQWLSLLAVSGKQSAAKPQLSPKT